MPGLGSIGQIISGVVDKVTSIVDGAIEKVTGKGSSTEETSKTDENDYQETDIEDTDEAEETGEAGTSGFIDITERRGILQAKSQALQSLNLVVSKLNLFAGQTDENIEFFNEFEKIKADYDSIDPDSATANDYRQIKTDADALYEKIDTYINEAQAEETEEDDGAYDGFIKLATRKQLLGVKSALSTMTNSDSYSDFYNRYQTLQTEYDELDASSSATMEDYQELNDKVSSLYDEIIAEHNAEKETNEATDVSAKYQQDVEIVQLQVEAEQMLFGVTLNDELEGEYYNLLNSGSATAEDWQNFISDAKTYIKQGG